MEEYVGGERSTYLIKRVVNIIVLSCDEGGRGSRTIRDCQSPIIVSIIYTVYIKSAIA